MKANVISVPIARSTLDWIETCAASGALEKDDKGRLVLNEKLAPVLAAFNTVLAGGKVSIRTTNQGDPKKAKRLANKFNKALTESHELTLSSGITIMGP